LLDFVSAGDWAMANSSSTALFQENKAAYDGMMLAALTYGEHNDTISHG